MKKFNKIFLSLLLVVCSVAMFACGGGSPKTPYSELEGTMTEIAAHDMFSFSSVDSVGSKYILKSFTSSGDKYVNESLVIPMNFINNYQDLSQAKEMKNLSGEQTNAIQNLERELTQFKEGYNQLKNEYDRFIIFQTPGSIYEGVRQAFLYEITDFIQDAYDLAFKLADVQIKVFNNYANKEESAEALTTNDTKFFRDYLALNVGHDYYNILLPAVKSMNYDTSSSLGTFLNNVKNDFADFLSLYVSKSNFADLTGEAATKKENGKDVNFYKNEKVTSLYQIENKLKVERDMLEKSLNEFSLYDYLEKYNCDIDSYNKVNAYAQTYYNQIQVYYLTTLKNYITYLRTILFRS